VIGSFIYPVTQIGEHREAPRRSHGGVKTDAVTLEFNQKDQKCTRDDRLLRVALPSVSRGYGWVSIKKRRKKGGLCRPP